MNWYLIYPIMILQNDINANVVHFNFICDDILIVMNGKITKHIHGALMLQNDINASVIPFHFICDDILIVMDGKSQNIFMGH